MSDETNAQLVGQTRLIVGAMCAGVIVMIGVAAFIVRGVQGNPEPGGNLISIVLAFISLVQASGILWAAGKIGDFLPAENGELAPGDEQERLRGLFRTQVIVRSAACEGAAMMNVVAYLVERNTWSLAVAGIFLFVLISILPTEYRLDMFLENNSSHDVPR